MIHNKLDKLFGQAGSVLGWLIMLGGFLISTTIVAVIVVIIGLFMALSYSAIRIDTENKRYNFYYSFFGLINIGKWKSINDIDGIAGISPIVNRTSYLPENRNVQLKTDNCFVVLFKNNPKKRIIVKALGARLDIGKSKKLVSKK